MILVKMVLKILFKGACHDRYRTTTVRFYVREMELNSKCKEKWEFKAKRQEGGGQQIENY